MNNKHKEKTLAELIEGVRPAPSATLKERALAAMARAYSSRPHKSVNPRSLTMRRFAFAGVLIFALAVGLGLFLPGRLSSPDAHAQLAAVAHAMEVADSLYAEYLPSTDLQAGRWQSPPPYSAEPISFYFSKDALYMRRFDSDGSVLDASGLDTANKEWWVYRDNKLYHADIAANLHKVNEVLDVGARLFLSGDQWQQLLGNEDLENIESSVTTETRDGRKVNILTFTGDMLSGRARNIFEVDAASNRLLRAYYYYTPEDGTEQLVVQISRVQYNAPPPASITQTPASTKVIKATADIEDNGSIRRLMLKSDNQVINQVAVPIENTDTQTSQRQPIRHDNPTFKIMRNFRTAQSVHLTYSPTDALQNMSGDLPGPPNPVEIWFSDTAFYARGTAGPQGKSFPAWGISSDTMEWWIWDGNNIYLADLSLLGDDAAQFVSRFRDLGFGAYFGDFGGSKTWNEVIYPEDNEITSESRDGRQVDIETIAGLMLDGRGKNVFEVDAESGRLVFEKRYFARGEAPEQLIAAITPQYDTPLPTNMATKPKGVPVVSTQVELEDNKHSFWLVMHTQNGQEIDRILAMKRDRR